MLYIFKHLYMECEAKRHETTNHRFAAITILCLNKSDWFVEGGDEQTYDAHKKAEEKWLKNSDLLCAEISENLLNFSMENVCALN